MNFKEAYEALKQGASIKREHWAGYWKWNPATQTIDMVCKDGDIVPIQQTKDIRFTLDNICQEDWEVCEKVPSSENLKISTFTFGEAIRKLKQGYKVARKGWNGKGMYLWLKQEVTIQKDWCKDPMLLDAFERLDVDQLVGLASISMKTADNKVLSGWLASQTDILAEDWVMVE